MLKVNRISFDQVWLKHAKTLAKRSSCSRLRVGCVIVSDDNRIAYSGGYNGNATGLPNKCDNKDKPGKCGCLHAELNAVVNCNTDRNNPKVVYITHSPCTMCAKLILNLGNVVRVVYEKDYRDNKGLQILFGKGITIQKV